MPRNPRPTRAKPHALNSDHRLPLIRRRLLAWYDRHQRRLPWRTGKGETPNPYHVLVSEAMLQQTQVATVVPYFHSFIQTWPTIRDLSQATEQDVLRLWQGLGYYRRARHLRAAAGVIVRDHSGQVPDSVDALRKLPGVGRYTAGAIASIAHGKPAPILDGNVARVLSRLFLIEQPVNDPSVQLQLWQYAEQLVPARRPGDFNQAMMELGALICTKANPACDACPLSKLCQARQADCVCDIPAPARRKAPTTVHHHVLAVERHGRYLFQQRPPTGLWSSMWQLPAVEDWRSRVERKTIVAWVRDHLGLNTSTPCPAGAFTHQTTHRTIFFHLWRASITSGRLRAGAGQWRTLKRLDDLPLSNPQRKAIALLSDQHDSMN